MITVIKRDGSSVDFDKTKIIDAIMKATAEVEDGDGVTYQQAEDIANRISKQKRSRLLVEQIQDQVENAILRLGKFTLAKQYITYRYKRTLARNQYKELIDAVGEKLKASDVQNQNANVDEYSFGGRMGEARNAVTKHYALNYVMDEKTKANHENNEVYVHDLDSYAVGMHNCLSVPFDMLLAKGFTTRQTDVRPAKSVNTAMQLVAVLFQLQSLSQFGGVSATHLDWTMVPYVRMSFAKHFKDGMKYLHNVDYKIDFDPAECSIESPTYTDEQQAYRYALDMTVKEVKQAVEGMYHNLNFGRPSGNTSAFAA